MSTQTNLRLPATTRQQIKEIRKRLGLTSDAQAVILAVDRMTQQEGGKQNA